MTRFRGHHLVCLHFYHGEGYSPDFISNLEKALGSVMLEGVEACEGADDICVKCPSLRENVCGYSENADTEIRKMDMLAMDLLGTHIGQRLQWDELEKKLAGIFWQWFRSCCFQCNWRPACERNEKWITLKG